MKLLFTLLVVLVAGASVALLLREDTGYVLLGYGHWTVEMSLVLFAILVLLFTVVVYFLIRLWGGVWRVPHRVGDWRGQRRLRKASAALTQGLVAQAEGDWSKAEKTLLAHAQNSQTPVLNYLAAARAAQEQGADSRRDRYLQLAHESAPAADIAVELTQAELQMEKGQLEQALATLMHLRQIAPRHAHVLKLLVSLYRQLEDWDHLLELMPTLRKRRVYPPDEIRQLERTCYLELLYKAGRSRDVVKVHGVWARVPKALRHDPELQSVYVGEMVELGESGVAETLLRETLDRDWNDHLVYLYGLVEGRDGAKQLAAAEGWLKNHSQNPTLLLTLGRLCLRQKLWGKARGYLEASVAAGTLPESYHCLAQLLEQLDEGEQAAEYYRKGLELASEQQTRQSLSYGRDPEPAPALAAAVASS